MKKLAFLTLIPFMAYAQTMPMEEEKEEVIPMMPAIRSSSSESVIVIMPKERAGDYKAAFEFLRKEKTSNKLFFQLKDGSTINNLIEVSLIGSGTLLELKYNSAQGIKYKIVPVEDITALYHQ